MYFLGNTHADMLIDIFLRIRKMQKIRIRLLFDNVGLEIALLNARWNDGQGGGNQSYHPAAPKEPVQLQKIPRAGIGMLVSVTFVGSLVPNLEMHLSVCLNANEKVVKGGRSHSKPIVGY